MQALRGARRDVGMDWLGLARAELVAKTPIQFRLSCQHRTRFDACRRLRAVSVERLNVGCWPGAAMGVSTSTHRLGGCVRRREPHGLGVRRTVFESESLVR